MSKKSKLCHLNEDRMFYLWSVKIIISEKFIFGTMGSKDIQYSEKVRFNVGKMFLNKIPDKIQLVNVSTNLPSISNLHSSFNKSFPLKL